MRSVVKPRLSRGLQDLLPEQTRARQRIIDVIRGVYESYGFVPLETAAIEYLDVLSGSAGEETQQSIFRVSGPEEEDLALSLVSRALVTQECDPPAVRRPGRAGIPLLGGKLAEIRAIRVGDPDVTLPLVLPPIQLRTDIKHPGAVGGEFGGGYGREVDGIVHGEGGPGVLSRRGARGDGQENRHRGSPVEDRHGRFEPGVRGE